MMETWKKRIPALLLALVMCLSLLPTAALAADEGDFTIVNGKLTKYNGPGGDVVIPEGVTNIGRMAFYSCTSLTSVTVPYGVTQITDYAFDGCTSLTRVTLPDSLDCVGAGAFSNCPSLDELVIPDSVTRYSHSVSNSVRKLTLGSGLDDPLCDGQSGWLMDNKNLTSLTIRGRVRTIDRNVFTSSRNLTEIHYSGTVKEWRDALDAGALRTVYDPNAYSNAMWCIPNATVYCSDGTIAAGTANKRGSDSGTTTNPGTQSGTLTLRRGPDSDSVDLSGMDYPARFYCYPTLIVDGVEVPESAYHITYSWSLIGLGARPMNNSTSDKYNCCEIQAPYSTDSNLRLTCRAVAEYNGASYTADVAWNNIYRSSDYNGSGSSGSSGEGSQVVVTFDSRGGSPVNSITVTAGQTYGTLPTPTRPGYKFVCWMTRGNVGVNANTEVDPIGTQTLYAYWEEDSGTTTSPNPNTPTTPAKPTTPTTPVTITFSDVPMGEYFSAPVSWALEKNITNGTSATRFSPYEQCTQVQILTFLYRAARGGGTAAAEDMTHAVNWARDMGVIDGSFDGSTPCTRATAVTYIWKAFGQPSMGSNSFTDVPADSASAVSWAVAKGVTNGTSTITFSPNKVCDRGEIVTFLYRAYH